MDERTLYKTLAEAPDDEGHCMVFADWLLERGDPMAEFLTLQLEHHKKKLDTLRAQRAQDLLIMNWKRWTGELSRVLHRRACLYERGFLRVANGGVGKSSPVEAIKDAPQWATVRELTITGPGEIVGALLESPWLTNLKILECPADALNHAKNCAFKLEQLECTGEGSAEAKPNASWSALELLTLSDFVPTMQLTAKEVHCSAGTFDGAVSLISGWLLARERPETVLVDAYGSRFRLKGALLEISIDAIDRRELRALRRLGEFELDVSWDGRKYRGPASALNW